MARLILLLAFGALWALTACGSDNTRPPPAESSFVSELEPASPGLRLDVTPATDRAAVRVLATGTADLFGVSLHVLYDAERFAVEELEQAPFLGPEGTEATMIAVAGEGDIALGGTRNDPSLGETTVADGTELASFTLVARSSEPGSLALEDVVARGSDGRYVSLDAERGTLTLSEVAP